jgi:hypothetical protein
LDKTAKKLGANNLILNSFLVLNMGNTSKTFPLMLVAAFIFAALFTGCLTATAQTTPAWNTQLVERHGDRNSIAIDTGGNPHIVYSQSYIPNGQNNPLTLIYSVRTGTNWTNQTVDVSASGGFLALDRLNHPHILYNKNNSLTYAVLNGNKWDAQNIDPTVSPLLLGTYTMVLDAYGIPHIMYFTFENKGNITLNKGYLNYAVLEDSKWKIQTIDTLTARSAYVSPSIVLDSNSNLHVIYAGDVQFTYSNLKYEEKYDVKYATIVGSNWSLQTVLKEVSEVGNLVVDSSGKPSFCYVSIDAIGTLKYAYLNGDIWLSKDVNSTQFGERQSKFYLNLNSDSNPQVFFYAESAQNKNESGLLKLQWAGSGWNTQNLGIIALNGSSIYEGSAHIDNLVFGDQGIIGLTYTGQIGTNIGAPVYGGLTYVTNQYVDTNPDHFRSTGTRSDLVSLTIVAVVIVVLIVVALSVLLFRWLRKSNLT